MKTAYAETIQWVRFNAWVTALELSHCNAGWLEPNTEQLIKGVRTDGAHVDAVLVGIEECAGVMWLLQLEHECLVERVHELSGPHAELQLPESVRDRFTHATGQFASLVVVRNSLVARVSLIERHEDCVDAHTRLVLRRHALVIGSLILPSLEGVLRAAGDAALGTDAESVASSNELDAYYRLFVPSTPINHPDTYLRVSLLRNKAT
jgi:hypothetical protein